MSPANIFSLQLVLGYVAGCSATACTSGRDSNRWTASQRSAPSRPCTASDSSDSPSWFPVVGSHLPAGFAAFAAYGDLATGVLAILALLTVRTRPLFWLFVVAFNVVFVVAFNVVGVADLVLNYYHAVQANLPAVAGELGATYAIPIIYVPLLMITHIAAFYMLVRPPARQALA